MLHLALFQPDIPQNAGTLLRLCACMGVTAHIIEPAGFPVADRAFRRAGLDYLDQVEIIRHVSFAAFRTDCTARRAHLVLVETTARTPYAAFSFAPGDVLMLGRESAGTPDEVAAACDAGVHIPMRRSLRSLNVAVAGAMVLGEALRQTGLFPAG
jgi:tRNA (cytidine/uridine-2'-O-)-methyltransferase